MNRLNHHANLRIALLTALALLVAQLGAQAHAYSHFNSASHPAGELDYHTAQCFDCLSFAPLLASAGGPSHALVVAQQGVLSAPNAALVTLTTTGSVSGFQSRAPPLIHQAT